MPLHLFRMVQITVYIIIMLKPYLSEKKVWNYLRRRSRHWFSKTGWVSGTKQGTQSSLWTFVRHHCFMEYIYIYIYSRLPGCHVGCWAAQMSIALTVSQTNTPQYIPAFCPEKMLRKNQWFQSWWLGYKRFWIIWFWFQCFERVNDIGFRFGAEVFTMGS